MNDSPIIFPRYPHDPYGIRGRAYDKQRIEDALRDLTPGQCASVIVGSKPDGQRDIHPCVVQAAHGHKTHHCGCGCRASWRYVRGSGWSVLGPLTNVVMSA